MRIRSFSLVIYIYTGRFGYINIIITHDILVEGTARCYLFKTYLTLGETWMETSNRMKQILCLNRKNNDKTAFSFEKNNTALISNLIV